MTWPTGIRTRILTFGSAVSHVDGTDLAMQLSLVSVLPAGVTGQIVWTATGQPLIPILVPLQASAGQVGQATIPVTDQSGYTDGNGNVIVPGADGNSFLYRAQILVINGTTAVYKSAWRMFAMPTGDGSPVDYDTMVPIAGSIGGTVVSVPDSWSADIASMRNTINNLIVPDNYVTATRDGDDVTLYLNGDEL